MHTEDRGCLPGASVRERATGRGSLLGRLWSNLWPFVTIPVVLTAFFASIGLVPGLRWVVVVFGANVIISLCIGGTIYLSYWLFGDWLLKRWGRGWRRFAINLPVLALCIVAGGELALFLLDVLPPFSEVNISRRGFYGVAAVIVSVIWAIEYILERHRERARQLELREEQARRQALRAQLEALQARTNPHFLYNALNTVAGLIEEDPKRAERALEKLSDLFRYALEGSRRERVPLADELAAVNDYLEMERLRFGERLRVSLDVEPGAETLAVPPLVLQLLVENAVRHGVAARTEGGAVRVAASRRDGALELVVEDDGPGPGGSPNAGTRTSLRELAERLELLYGDQAGLESGAGESGGYRVRLRLPMGETA